MLNTQSALTHPSLIYYEEKTVIIGLRFANSNVKQARMQAAIAVSQIRTRMTL